MNSTLNTITSANIEHPASSFQLWSEYDGCLYFDKPGTTLETSLFGFQNKSLEQVRTFEIPSLGTLFGFVVQGEARLSNDQVSWTVQHGQWFCIPSSVQGQLSPNSKLVIVMRHNYRGLYTMGGPVEPKGRLRYIDGCSDTLLLGPPMLGDPCFNLLHFPAHVRQTPHTHPSTRMGMVISGKGYCEYGDHRVALNVGDIFHIPAETIHNFCTEEDTLNVVAYHPDSDWGPEHEDHPMINRTWVDGKKIATHSDLSLFN